MFRAPSACTISVWGLTSQLTPHQSLTHLVPSMGTGHNPPPLCPPLSSVGLTYSKAQEMNPKSRQDPEMEQSKRATLCSLVCSVGKEETLDGEGGGGTERSNKGGGLQGPKCMGGRGAHRGGQRKRTPRAWGAGGRGGREAGPDSGNWVGSSLGQLSFQRGREEMKGPLPKRREAT